MYIALPGVATAFGLWFYLGTLLTAIKGQEIMHKYCL